MGIARAGLAAAHLPGSLLCFSHSAPALARPHAMPGVATSASMAHTAACTASPAPGWALMRTQVAPSRRPTTLHLLPRMSEVGESDPGLRKAFHVASRISSLGTRRRSAGVHARSSLLPITLSWKPAGLSTRTPTLTSRESATGAAKGGVGVPGTVLPARSAVTSTPPGMPLAEGPTAKMVAEVVVAVCDVMLPAKSKSKTATMPAGRKAAVGRRLLDAARGRRRCTEGGGASLRGIGGREGEWCGAEGHTLWIRARSPSPCAVTTLCTTRRHPTSTSLQPFVTCVVDVACPFSSSFVIGTPTGWLLQLRLGDALGGRTGCV